MMNKSAIAWALLLSLLLLLGGCEGDNPRPENLVPEDRYINLLIELQLLESYRLSTPQDSLSIDSLKNEIFERYEVNQQQFMASHVYYQRQIEPQKERIVAAIDRLRKQMVQEGLTDSALILRRDAQRGSQ